MNIYNIIGFSGVILVLLAYFFLQLGLFKSDGFHYQIFNLIGSMLVGGSLLFIGFNFSAFFLEVAWASISLYGLINFIKSRKKKRFKNIL